jgi:hypothetical protein
MLNTTNGYCPDFATGFDSQTEGRFVHENDSARGTTMKLPSIAGWFRILRAHYQFPMFQAIRYALWLGR